MKFTDTWTENDVTTGNGTNESGFSAISGGARYYYGLFKDIGSNGYWWSATEANKTYAWNRYLDYSINLVFRNYFTKADGFSVRCLRE